MSNYITIEDRRERIHERFNAETIELVIRLNPLYDSDSDDDDTDDANDNVNNGQYHHILQWYRKCFKSILERITHEKLM